MTAERVRTLTTWAAGGFVLSLLVLSARALELAF
jgi:hypothetical protein